MSASLQKLYYIICYLKLMYHFAIYEHISIHVLIIIMYASTVHILNSMILLLY